MKKVFEQILTWFEDTFQDGETEDWYHDKIVDSVVARYTTKAELKEELSNIINSFQQEQPEVDLEKEIAKENKKWTCYEEIGFGALQDARPFDGRDIDRIARYFYELGQCNARKEE